MTAEWVWAFLDRPMADFERSARYWTGLTATRLTDRRGDRDEFATLLPERGDGQLKLQGIFDPLPAGSGGIHLDLEVPDVPAAVAAAQGLGATLLPPKGDWTLMRSPAGWAFCLQPWPGARVAPPPVTHPDGTVTRPDQVCIDIGPQAYEAEAAFWAALTGWRRPGALPAYEALVPPRAGAVRLLLQRLERDRPVSAHLDFACSDVEDAVGLHERAGARIVARHSGWVVLADPTGAPYCLTGRKPAP